MKNYGTRKSWHWAVAFTLGAALGMWMSQPAAAPDAPFQTEDLPGANLISLKVAEFDVRQGPPVIDPELEIQDFSPGAEGYYLVQFKGPITDLDKAALEAEGATVYGYYPMYALAVKMTPEARGRLSGNSRVNWTGVYQPSWKILPSLRDGVLTPYESGTLPLEIEQNLTLVLGFWPGEGSAAKGAVMQAGGHVTDHRMYTGVYEFMEVAAHPSAIRDLARIPAVNHIELRGEKILHNDRAAILSKANQVANYGFTSGLDTSLDGTSGAFQVKIGHYDSGINASHADFSSATITFDAGADNVDNGSGGHGTHTAGSVLGDGGESTTIAVPPGSTSPLVAGQFRGAVPTAAMFHMSLAQADNETQVLQKMSVAGCHLMTNSWGWGSVFGPTTDYNANAVTWDTGVWDADGGKAGLQPLVVFFSAGNNSAGSSAGCAGGNDDIGTPGISKNVITVGASQSNRSGGCSRCGNDDAADYHLATYSSRGPGDPDGTGQGLFKPEVTQAGSEVISVKSAGVSSVNSCSTVSPPYRYECGTSMSTPLTAGLGAVLYQDYYINRAVTNPKPSLIKATLVNGAWGITNASCPADYTFEVNKASILQGWGYVDLKYSLYGTSGTKADRDIFFENEVAANAVATGGNYQFTVSVNSNTEPLKISLAWTDYPAAAGAGSPLVVNDLDLEVTAPGGQIYYGNNFTGIWSVTTASKAVRDRYNVVENVYVQSPAAGTWTIKVNGFNVPQDREPGKAGTNQNFSLVWSGDFVKCAKPAATVLSGSAASSTSVSLSWTNVPGADSYNIYRSSTSCAAGMALITNVTGTSYTDSGLTAGATYYYIVRTVDNACEANDSNCVTITLAADLVYVSHAINDSACNNNGVVDPGETITMPVTLRNDGDLGATSISAKVSTATPGVIITTDTAGYPNAAAGATVTSNSPHYVFTVSSGVPCGTLIDFSLAISSAQGSWARAFQVMVGSGAPPSTEAANQSSNLVLSKNSGGTVAFTPSLALTLPIASAIVTSPSVTGAAGEYQIHVVSPNGTYLLLTACGAALQPTYDITAFYNGPNGGPGTWLLCASRGSATTCSATACAADAGGPPNTKTFSSARIDVTKNNATCTATSCGACSLTAATTTPAGPITFCDGGSQLLTCTPTGGVGPLTYQWRNGGVNIGGATASTYSATATGTYDCVITDTGEPGCNRTSNVVTVTERAPLAASVAPVGPVTFCDGGSQLLTVTPSGGSGPYSYQWRNGGVNIGGATASTYSATATGTYDCVVTDAGVPACGSVTSNVVTVTVNPNPAPTITASCNGALRRLDAGAGYDSYSWVPGGATTQIIDVADDGSLYTVTVMLNGCAGSDSHLAILGCLPSPKEPSDTDICGVCPPLTVTNVTATTVNVEEIAAATDYVVYDNAIGMWYNDPTGCSAPWVSLAGTVNVSYPVGDNTWIVLAARNGTGESSAGRDSTATERKSIGTWTYAGACP
jgi:hypothetical protein